MAGRCSVLALLLATLVMCSCGHCADKTTTTKPVTTTTSAPTNPVETGGWQQALQNAVAQLFNNQNEAQVVNGTASALLTSFMSQLPGILQGLGSLNLTQGDPASLLASLFSNPSLQNVPPGGNASQQAQAALQQVMSALDPQSQCTLDLLTWTTALQRADLAQDMWAFQMLDAMGKVQAGILTGQLLLVGDYDQCLDVSYTDPKISPPRTLTTHYCNGAFSIPFGLGSLMGNQPMAMSVCMPSSCNDQQVGALFAPALEALGSTPYGIQCLETPDPAGDSYFIGITTTLAVMAALCLLGTVYGAVLDRQKAQRQKQQQQGLQHAQEPQAVEMKSYTNQAYVINGEPSLSDPQKVNGTPGLTHTHTATMAQGNAVNGDASKSATNGDVALAPHVTGYVRHREGGDGGKVAEEGMIKPELPRGPVVCAGDPGPKPSASGSRPASSPPQEEGNKLLLVFSVLKNGAKVLKCGANPADISCLHGIRVLSICWVVLGHVFSMMNGATGNSASMYATKMGDWTFMVILAGVLSVDTFFLLSGCLSAFLFLRSCKKSGLSLGAMILYYVHRVWRLTPLYAVLLFVYMGIFPYLRKGPYQSLPGGDSQTTCRDYWYLNLLYVNNIVGSISDVCFGWSWYLSNDMQFSFLAPIVLFPWAMKRGPVRQRHVLGLLVCFLWILTHCITSGVITYKNDLSMLKFDRNQDYMEKVYFPPWTRIGPYAVGLLLGYILFHTPPKFSMSRCVVWTGWTLSTAVALTLVYVRFDNVKDFTKGLHWSTSENAAFESLDKVVWAVCVAWVIYACYTGHGGFVNTLLSWTAWQPLSRLTYGVYLIHLVVLFVFIGNMRKPFYLDGWSGTTLFLSVTVLSFLFSFAFSMLIEAPMLGLEKIVLGKIFRSKK